MILGVDHLAMSVTDTDAASAEMQASGFQCEFVQRNVRNDVAKNELLTARSEAHDLGVFRPDSGGVAIEITNHRNAFGNRRGPFEYGLDAIRLRSKNVESESDFLKAIGFADEGNGRLKLPSPVANWRCEIQLIDDPETRACFLDDEGYTCLAFLTSNMTAAIDRVAQRGARQITDPFEIDVHRRRLNVSLFRSAEGTIYELIEVKTKRRATPRSAELGIGGRHVNLPTTPAGKVGVE